MRAPLLVATILSLLADPAVADPGLPMRLAPARAQLVDFDLLKQAEQQSEKDRAEEQARKAAADKAAEDAARQAQIDKAAADKAAAAPPTRPMARMALVTLKFASGAAAGSAELDEAPGDLHLRLDFANIPVGRYRLLVLPRSGCGKPFIAPVRSVGASPVVTSGNDGRIAAAFTMGHVSLDKAMNGEANGLVLALYPDDPKQPAAVWTACGAAVS